MTSAVLTGPGPTRHLPGPAPAPAAPRRRPARRWWRLGLLGAGLVLAVVELRGHLPDPAATWTAMRQARPAWLLAAAGLAVVSMATFAEQQRRFLDAFGVRMPARASLRLSYARSAMATALPGGSAVSAGYAFRRFRGFGASQPVAAAVMLLSGVASMAGLALLYTGAALAWASPSPRTMAIIAVTGTAVVALSMHRLPASAPAVAGPTGSAPVGATRFSRALGTVRRTAVVARTVPLRTWLSVVALAILNWLTDLACLLAAVHAVGLSVPARAVASAYLAAQLVRQIPATPGGIGFVEAALILALTTAGALQTPAAAAVLLYRLLSCWIILPIGLICWSASAQQSSTVDRQPA